MDGPKTDLTAEVAAYYSRMLLAHGMTARGVDWNSEDSQRNRFDQLARLLPESCFSVNDLGCGYGAFHGFLSEGHRDFCYFGYDVSAAMVEAARVTLPAKGVTVIEAAIPTVVADFTVASGIFNVRVGRTKNEWYDYLLTTLDAIDRSSRHGFAFNCLTGYSDPEKMRPDLYYADPLLLFDHCKRRYAQNVALLHDYGLWEFTMLVRKTI